MCSASSSTTPAEGTFRQSPARRASCRRRVSPSPERPETAPSPSREAAGCVQPFRPGGVLLDVVKDRSDGPAAVAEDAGGLGDALVDDLDSGFAEVVRAYERIVYTVALRLAGCPAEGEDLAAEAFLRAYRALRGYDEARLRSLRLRPWLLTIVRNTARNRARDARRRPAPPPPMEPVEEAAGGP